MDDRSVCAPQLAESDALNNTTSPPHAASVTDASKVINTKIDSAQFEGEFCLRHANSADQLAESMLALLADWLASSASE